MCELNLQIKAKVVFKGHVDIKVDEESDKVQEHIPDVKLGKYKIVACDLHKKFGKKVAVDRFSILVEPNECMVLLGTNGAGKTTTFNMMNGIVNPTYGTT